MSSLLRSQRGQGITEALLILVMLMGFTMIVANYFKNEAILKQLITGPWQSLAGMMENGLWQKPEASAVAHPAGFNRHISSMGEEAR
jgi:hypothetical protein